jgi:hypothetical protein
MVGLPIRAGRVNRARLTQNGVSGKQARFTLPPADSPPANPATVGYPPKPRPLPNGVTVVNDDINVLALIKGKERYIFLYDDSQRAEALRMLGRHASNPELSFSWYDAAVLSQKIRQEERQRRSRLRTPQVTDSEELF